MKFNLPERVSNVVRNSFPISYQHEARASESVESIICDREIHSLAIFEVAHFLTPQIWPKAILHHSLGHRPREPEKQIHFGRRPYSRDASMSLSMAFGQWDS
ncbi:MAG: hypothetical protein ACI93T_001333 [Porticoccaceae bacterium]|jgi:hypothetical protein